MKLSISIIQCPRCGYVLPAHDMEDSQIQEGPCPDCDLMVEVVYDEYGVLKEVKPSGYIVAGKTASYRAGRDDIMALRLDKNGKIDASCWTFVGTSAAKIEDKTKYSHGRLEAPGAGPKGRRPQFSKDAERIVAS